MATTDIIKFDLYVDQKVVIINTIDTTKIKILNIDQKVKMTSNVHRKEATISSIDQIKSFSKEL